MDVREKLVGIVCDAMESDGCIGHCNHSPCFEVERVVNALIDNGVTVQEWIPASEPPKKITNKVIVLCKNGYIGYGHYENYNGKQTWYNLESGKPFTDWDFEDCESYEVTHWMPLPQPPKGE